MVFFCGLLAALGLGPQVGILLIVLIAGGSVLFLRDRQRRDWLRLHVDSAARATRGLVSCSVSVRGVPPRARRIRISRDGARQMRARLQADASVDPEAPTFEHARVVETPTPGCASISRVPRTGSPGIPVSAIVRAARRIRQRFAAPGDSSVHAAKPSRAGIREAAGIGAATPSVARHSGCGCAAAASRIELCRCISRRS